MKHITAVVALCAATLVARGNEEELYTNVYVVPPTFLSATLDGAGPPEDPFADPATKGEEGDGEASSLPRPTAKGVLENAGITFGSGSSAIYNPSTSQLIIRNTQAQMELVEAYIDSLVNNVEKQIYLTFREVSFQGNPFADENAWGPFAGLLDIRTNDPDAGKVVTSREDLIQQLSQPPEVEETEMPNIARGVGGALTDPQAQVLLRALRQDPAFEIDTLPSLMVRSGQSGLVQKNEKRYGVIAVLGADEFTIDLEVLLPPHGEGLRPVDREGGTPYQVTIWDGQFALLVEKGEEDANRIVFVRGQIVDPAGLPIHRKAPETEIPEPPVEPETQEPQADATEHSLTPAEQDNVHAADDAALRASQLMADADYRGAYDHYARALTLLPEHPFCDQRRDAYTAQFERARRTLASLPSRPLAVHVVRQGESLHQIAREHEVAIEPLKKMNHLHSDAVEVGQLLLLPQQGPRSAEQLFPRHDVGELLRQTIIREVNLQEVSLIDSLALLQQELIFSQNPLLPELSPRIILEDAEKNHDVQITLRLSNVPASEALRYITSLASCRYEIDGSRIVILSQG